MMDYLYQMSNQQLARCILSYINRTEALQKQVSDILDQHVSHSKEAIMEEYKALKQAIRDDARQVRQKEFSKHAQANPALSIFARNISEAAAFGLLAPVNSKIDRRLFSSIAEAAYKLRKNYSKEKWEALSGE